MMKKHDEEEGRGGGGGKKCLREDEGRGKERKWIEGSMYVFREVLNLAVHEVIQ